MSSSAIAMTAIVSTRNEEAAIARCLRALDRFEQVIVVDSMSTDKTTSIARRLGVEVVDFVWNGRYPKKKQWCLDNLQIRNRFVLFVDADEYPSPELYFALERIADRGDDSAHAYDVPLAYSFSGRRLRHGHRVMKRILLQPAFTRFPEMDDLDFPGMGELEGHYQPVVQGRVERLDARMVHDDPDPVGTWIDRHNNYSDWEAHLRVRDTATSVRKFRSRQGRIFDALPGKPAIFFAYSYLIRRGFLDGRAGLDYATALSFYYWMINLKVRALDRHPAQGGSTGETSE